MTGRVLPLALTVLALGASVGSAADWPQFLGPNRDGHSPETGLRWDWPAAGPPRVWEYRVGAGWGGPVVAGGRVLAFHREGDDAVLDCCNAADGHRLWRATSPTDYRDQFNF